MPDAYPNLLLTGKHGLYSLRLVAGRPAQVVAGKQHKGLLFEAGQTFCYVLAGGGQASARAGQHSLPGLEKPVVLLLEAAGKLRVQRLFSTVMTSPLKTQQSVRRQPCQPVALTS